MMIVYYKQKLPMKKEEEEQKYQGNCQNNQ